MALGVNGVAQGALPVATGAGEIPRSTGAGSNYAGVSQGDVLADAIGDVGAANVRTALDVYSAAEVDAAVAGGAGAVTTVYDFAAATGFTTDNGVGGTAAVTAGVARLSNPAGTAYRTAAVAYQGPSIRRALPSPSYVDVAVRLAVGPSVVGTQVTLEISDAATAGTRVCVLVQQTRDVSIYRQDTNAILATAGGAFASFTGQEWVRIRGVPGFILAHYGVGVGGAMPAAWTQIGSALALSAFWSHVTVGLVVVSTGAESTVDLDDLTVLAVEAPSL